MCTFIFIIIVIIVIINCWVWMHERDWFMGHLYHFLLC